LFARPAIWLILAATLVGAFVAASPADAAKTKPPTASTVVRPADDAIPVDTSLPTDALYLAPALRTNSATLAHNATTGLHSAYVGFGDENKGAMYYARCIKADCVADDAWQTVELRLPSAVRVQIALTAAGQPRLLGTGWSSDAANGLDYWYAACDADCMTMGNWTLTKVISTSDGVMSNLGITRLPNHSFALDENDRPRFIVTDANYFIEPDHYGAFYMACERNCAEAGNWTETNLANHVDYSTESFSYPALALAPGGKVRMVANVYALDEAGKDLDDGLYYYECDRACTTRANWTRTLVLDVGGGSYPNPTWDLETLSNGNPRVMLFAGDGMKDQGLSHQLIYAWCDSQCTKGDGDNWFGNPIGVGERIGESPDLELAADGHPLVAFVSDGSEAGIAYCTKNCEVPAKGEWTADFAERSTVAAEDRPTALPFTCDGELWNGEAPSLTLIDDQPQLAYNMTVQARCLYKVIGEPEITYQFHEIWRGGRFVRVKL
jgi:hypothetical protein